MEEAKGLRPHPLKSLRASALMEPWRRRIPDCIKK